jgi:Phosphomethylpyrimidine kinase
VTIRQKVGALGSNLLGHRLFTVYSPRRSMNASIIPPVVLTIAGTDPSGGAGIQVSIVRIYQLAQPPRSNDQADLKTFTALHCYGTSVTTALVAQNTMGVQEVHAPPPPFVEKQVRALLCFAADPRFTEISSCDLSWMTLAWTQSKLECFSMALSRRLSYQL